MEKFKNTMQKGSVRYVVFKEEDSWYAVGLEFNIVESGDDPQMVLFNLFEAIKGYVKSFTKAHARPHMLNQKTNEEYEKMWKNLTRGNDKPIKSPYEIYTFGKQLLSV
ncbi:hypothetical protein C4572_03505 [Candidatus Parcubacteria bacterium]|nr:MAG: hypothetical protein C4572_03505 [Candidatus Parcubacteria bacterium]